MGKNFSNSINQAAKGGGLAGLIPTSDESAKRGQQQPIVEESKSAGRPPRKDKDNKNAPAAEKGTKPGEMRKTYLVRMDTAEDLEAIAYWERETIKDVINKALSAYVNEYALNSKNKANVLPSLRIKPPLRK